MGNGETKEAQNYFKAVISVASVVFVLQSAALLIWYDDFFYFVNDDPRIAEKAKQVQLVFVINIFPDCMVIALRGVFKALGLQSKLLPTHIFAQGFLTSFLLYVFFDMGSTGIWLAKLFTSVYIPVSYLIILRDKDWDKQSLVTMSLNNSVSTKAHSFYETSRLEDVWTARGSEEVSLREIFKNK